MDNTISFLAYPVIWFVYRVEVFLFLLLSFIFLSQTDLPLSEIFADAKWVILIVFAIFEYLLLRFISLDVSKLRKLPPHVYLFGIFILYLVLSSPWSMDFQMSLSKIISLMLLLLLSFFIIPYYSEELNKKAKLINAIYYFFVLGIICNTVIILAEPSQIFSGRIYVRFRGIFENPNTLGLFCFAAQPILFYKYMTSESKSVRLASMLFVGLSIGLALVAFSRASILAMLIFLVSFSYFYNKKFFAVAVVGSLIAGIVLLSSPLLLELIRLAEDPFSHRDKLWNIGVDSWKANKAFGVGYGTAGLITSNEFVLVQKGLTSYWLGSHFHNIYVEVLCETGLIGLGLFLLILFSIGHKTLYLIKSSTGKERVLSVCYFSLLLAVIIYSFFESFTLSAGNISSVTFWILTGLAVHDNHT